MLETIFLIILIINLPIILFFKTITKLIGINDKADNLRKLHKADIPLFGGILILLNLFFSYFRFFLNLNLVQQIITTREYVSFCLGIILFFLIGIYDDKFDLSANKKLFLNFFILLVLTLIDDNLVIKG